MKAASTKREAEQQYKRRRELVEARSDVVIGFIRVMLPVLVEVYGASAATKIRTKVLGAILRAIAFCDEEKLEHALKVRSARLVLGYMCILTYLASSRYHWQVS